MKVLVACEFSGTVRDAFIRAGHDAMSCDLLPTESPGPHYQGNVFDIIADGWDLMIAHPDCTYLNNAGVRWLHERPWRWHLMRSAAHFFKAFMDAPIEYKAIENPIMHGYGKEIIGRCQDQVVQPWWFGDRKMKATCWWLDNLPPLVKTDDVGPAPKSGTPEYAEWAECHHASPGKDRGKLRSEFYPGMADACAKQWGTPQTGETPRDGQ